VCSFRVTLPDTARIRTLANAQIVFGKTANEAVMEILDGAGIDERSLTWKLTMRRQDGTWLVSLSENEAWFGELGLSELINFFAKY
jgi:hypothetical protein